MKSKWKKLPVVLIGIIAIAVCGCSNDLQELNQKRSSAAKENTESTETVRTGTWETAAQTWLCKASFVTTDSLWCLS